MYNPGLDFSVTFTIPWLLFLAIAAVFYVFNSLALFTIAKRRGISAPYPAWIPFASTFLFGKIAEQYEAAESGRSKPYRKRSRPAVRSPARRRICPLRPR